MEGDSRQCKGTRKDGRPCTVRAVLPSGYCFAHDPGNAEAKRVARQQGGKNKSTVARAARALPASLHDVSALILRSLSAVEAGTMRASQGQAIAALAGAFVRIHEAGEQEARIASLEEQVAAVRRR